MILPHITDIPFVFIKLMMMMILLVGIVLPILWEKLLMTDKWYDILFAVLCVLRRY